MMTYGCGRTDGPSAIFHASFSFLFFLKSDAGKMWLIWQNTNEALADWANNDVIMSQQTESCHGSRFELECSNIENAYKKKESKHRKEKKKQRDVGIQFSIKHLKFSFRCN